jgi:hypothetical protein
VVKLKEALLIWYFAPCRALFVDREKKEKNEKTSIQIDWQGFKISKPAIKNIKQ